MSKEEIVSINLLEAAIAQRKFLKLVDEHPCLYVGPHVQNAVRRYEVFWLPLIAEFPDATVAAPLDIAWVWHVHMLSPLAYERDCNEIVSTLVDHKILVGEEREAGLQKAKLLWHQLYGNEPFEVDLSAPASIVPHVSRIQYDIVAGCSRQRVFYYQVSLPHYGDRKFLKEAVERYKQHLRFAQSHPGTFLVPCFDSDLIWHAHQAHPLAYRTDSIKFLGKVLGHDDSVNDRQPGSKRSTSAQTTKQLWSAANMEYERNGSLYRGEPPLTIEERGKPVDYSSMLINEYSIDVLEIEIGISQSNWYELRVDVSKKDSGNVFIVKKFKGPAAHLFHPPPDRPSTFVCRKETNNFFQVEMYRKRRLGCCFVGMAEESDQRCLLKLEPFIRRSLEAPQVITQREYFSSENYVKITAVVHPPSPKEYRFRIKPEEGLREMSDAATILSTPMLSVFKTLSFTPSVECQLQKVFDFHDRLAFSCRVMHKGGMGQGNHPMSVVVINNAGDIVSTAHLLQRSTLPSWKQVMNDRKGCCTLEDNERAMLIRGSKDWGICIGRWENQCAIKFFSLFEKQEWKSVSSNLKEFSIELGNKMFFRVDLRNGIIVIPPDVSYVPETIALGFAIAILYVLCQPISNETLYYDPSCRCSRYPTFTHPHIPGNLRFAAAVGYDADKLRNHIIRTTCARCLESRRRETERKREMERKRKMERERKREMERERKTYSRTIVSNSLFSFGVWFDDGGCDGGGCDDGGCDGGGCDGGGCDGGGCGGGGCGGC